MNSTMVSGRLFTMENMSPPSAMIREMTLRWWLLAMDMAVEPSLATNVGSAPPRRSSSHISLSPCAHEYITNYELYCELKRRGKQTFVDDKATTSTEDRRGLIACRLSISPVLQQALTVWIPQQRPCWHRRHFQSKLVELLVVHLQQRT